MIHFLTYADYQEYVNEEWQGGYINELEEAGYIVPADPSWWQDPNTIEFRILTREELQELSLLPV